MEDIYQPNETFDFNKLILLTPTVLNGGNYFIKFRINSNPLYIQPPKCKSKQSIIKSGKRIFCDLMFNNENESFIEWMEYLETYCQEKLFENRKKWFESDLDEHDIENSFTSPLKVIKSGKFYNCRINIPSLMGNCNLKVYNEEENEISIDNIKENVDVMTILEVQGIRCSIKSFQIELEAKQLMVLKPKNLFEKCIFRPNNNISEPLVSEKLVNINEQYVESHNEDPQYLEEINNNNETINTDKTENTNLVIKENEPENITIIIDEKEEKNNDENIENNDANDLVKKEEKNDKGLEIISKYNGDPSILEVDFDINSIPSTENVEIKERNSIYYQMYKEAKQKAKVARNLAISAYLEAKDIKNTYMLDDEDDSDSELNSNDYQNMFDS
jgi:hypothetical protein